MSVRPESAGLCWTPAGLCGAVKIIAIGARMPVSGSSVLGMV